MTWKFESLTIFGEKIGLAFQIEDDILDEISTDEILGKPSGSDQQQHKMTYPAVHGMNAAKTAVADLTSEALVALDSVQIDSTILHGIAKYLVTRKY